MKSIALYCNWGVFVDESGVYIPSIHSRYIIGLKNLGYEKIYLVSKVSSKKSDSMDYFFESDELKVIGIKWFSNYMSSLGSFFSIFKASLYLRRLNLSKIYVRTYEPFGWLFVFCNFNIRNDILMHYISDPKTAIYNNSNDGALKKTIRYILFLPDFYFTQLFAFFCNVSSNGPVPKNNVPELISKKMNTVVESALLESDIRNINERTSFTSHFAKDDMVTFLYVGYIRPSKGIDKLIEAVCILRDKGYKFKLTLVGDGEFTKDLKTIITDNNLTSCITLVGYVPFSQRLLDFYTSHDVFVNPSPSETGPRVLLEARVCGCKLISTDIGYAADIITNNEIGRIISCNNVALLVESMEYYLVNTFTTEIPSRNKLTHSISVEEFFKSVL